MGLFAGIVSGKHILNDLDEFNKGKWTSIRGYYMDCPLSKFELGNSTWMVLHSVAAHAPENFNEKEGRQYKEFFETFPYVYASRSCALNFLALTQEHPPVLTSRAELSIWLCKLHNIVNQKLGKPSFTCTLKNLDQRWRKGPIECYEPQDDTEAKFIVY